MSFRKSAHDYARKYVDIQRDQFRSLGAPTLLILAPSRDITETSDNGNLTSDHDIGSTLDTIDQGFTALKEHKSAALFITLRILRVYAYSVKVVELGLGNGV